MSDLSSALSESSLPLPELLTRASTCLAGLGEDYAVSLSELELLRQRLGEGRFHLAVLGQFKRGKSTLLNALLGDDLLPTDILPVTAIPTYIKAGDRLGVEVHFIDGTATATFDSASEQSITDFLSDYVTESGNPHNQRQVSRVEIGHPSPLLQQGVVLIDTPGIGSTLKHNTEVAHQVLSQCDAALFLVSPDPPITEMELDYLQQIKQQLPRTFYLLNKVDFLDEADRAASLKFLGQQLYRFYDATPQVWPISARNGLQARLQSDEAGWKQSGMQRVEQGLIDFFVREKQQTLQLAVAGRIRDLLERTVMQIRLSLSALKLPEDELQQRLQQFNLSLPAIEREQNAAADVLRGDLQRTIDYLATGIAALRERSLQQILTQVENHLQTVEDPEEMEQLVHGVIAEQTADFFAPEMRNIAEMVRKEATSVLAINQQRSDQLIAQVRQTAAELFDIPYQAPVASSYYRPFEVPAWSNDLFTSAMDPLGQKLSRKFFTKKYRRKRTVNRLREGSRKLLDQNVEQIRWALRKGLDESFRQFAAELKEQLEKTIVASRKAMEVALQRSESCSRETAPVELLLQRGLGALESIKSDLCRGEDR